MGEQARYVGAAAIDREPSACERGHRYSINGLVSRRRVEAVYRKLERGRRILSGADDVGDGYYGTGHRACTLNSADNILSKKKATAE